MTMIQALEITTQVLVKILIPVIPFVLLGVGACVLINFLDRR